jgi:hypothetical protein
MNSVALLVCLFGLAKTFGNDANLAYKFAVLALVTIANLLHNYNKG